MSRSSPAGLLVGASALALVVAGGAGPARGQGQAGRKIIEDVKAMREAAENRPIPTAESVEAGESPPASVSFQAGLRAGTPAQSDAGGGASATGSTPVRVSVSRPVGAAAGDGDELAYDEGTGPPAEVPELHTVAAGDTLWSLCRTYYGDPFAWPQLWALNPLITNPHWIFPGDIVRLRAPGEAGAAPAEAPVALDEGPRIHASRGPEASEGPVFLREVGFLDNGELRAAGRITGSKEEKILLATGDQAYVTFPKDKPLRAGQRYTVFAVDRDSPVIDPSNRKVVGYLVRIYGDLLLEQVADDHSGRGTLLDMTDVVERGYYVSQAIKPFKRVAVRPSNVNLTANVIASFSPTNMLAPASFVVLSRGAADGLEVGNRTYVVRRGDGYARLMEGWERFDPQYPKEVVAELLVVEVRERTSVAWINRATKEIRVGETTEARKGY